MACSKPTTSVEINNLKQKTGKLLDERTAENHIYLTVISVAATLCHNMLKTEYTEKGVENLTDSRENEY